MRNLVYSYNETVRVVIITYAWAGNWHRHNAKGDTLSWNDAHNHCHLRHPRPVLPDCYIYHHRRRRGLASCMRLLSNRAQKMNDAAFHTPRSVVSSIGGAMCKKRSADCGGRHRARASEYSYIGGY